jgi:hypothetical protein
MIELNGDKKASQNEFVREIAREKEARRRF